jgi:hypothetical protein
MVRAIALCTIFCGLASCKTRLYELPASHPSSDASLPLCENGRLDPGESDIDCGGCCTPCPVSRRCGDARDCVSDECTGGICVAPSCPGCLVILHAQSHPMFTAPFVVGDFTGDGIPDLAGGMVEIGSGGGQFTERELGLPGLAPFAATDLDGDGHLDLVVSGFTKVVDLDSGDLTFTTTLKTARGNGDGTFAAPLDIAIDGAVIAMVAADFDEDGHPDLASVEQRPGDTAHQIMFRWGKGDGSFASTTTVEVGAGPTALATGHFDSQCGTDLAIAFLGGTAAILQNRSARGFALAASQPVQGGPYSLAVGDFNHDQHLDLVVGDNRPSPQRAQVDLLLGNGDGTLQEKRSFGSGFQTTSVATADLDGDGNLDVILGTTPANGTSPDFPLWILRGDGTGSFADPRSFGLYTGIAQVAVADLDRDGKADVAFAGNILLNQSK